MKRALSLILVALMALMLVPAIGVAAADDAVVYLNGTTGADANDGKTAATAVATFGKAVEVANTFADAAGVTVVVTGETAIPEAQYVLPESAKPIVVTSVYGGTDYKAQGAQFITHDSNCAAIHFNGKFTFENITIKTTNKNSIFSLQYNSFTAGEGVDFVTVQSADAATSYPILLVGCNTQGGVPNDKAITPTTFTDDVTVEVNSGTWAYVRGGDRDSASVFDADLVININNGIIMGGNATASNYFTSGNATAPTGKSGYGENATMTLNLNGGEVTNLMGCTCVKGGTGCTCLGDITININDGVKLSGYVCAVMNTNNVFNGKLVINLNGGDLSGVIESRLANLSVKNGGTGTVTVNHNANDAKSAAAFKALKDVCVDDTDVIYGELAAAPVVTDAPATEAPATEAPATQAPATEAPATQAPATDAPVATTEAPAQPEDTPATGDASVMVVFAAAAVICVAAVVVIKKREN